VCTGSNDQRLLAHTGVCAAFKSQSRGERILLKIELRPSRRLLWIITAAHVAAAIAAALTALPLWVKTALIAFICANCGVCVGGLAGWSAGNSIVSLEFSRDGTVSIWARDGTRHDGCILDTSFVSRHLIVLNVRLTEGAAPWHVILLSDSARACDLRRLRILLRWGKAVRAA
jgi:hypothetical protein